MFKQSTDFTKPMYFTILSCWNLSACLRPHTQAQLTDMEILEEINLGLGSR